MSQNNSLVGNVQIIFEKKSLIWKPNISTKVAAVIVIGPFFVQENENLEFALISKNENTALFCTKLDR